MPEISSSVEIKASPKIVYGIVTDFEKYPEFLPETKSVEIKKEGRSPQVRFQIQVIKTISYLLQFNLKPLTDVCWKLVEGDIFKRNSGFWKFEEVKKGVTKATYSIDVDFGVLVPRMITHMLVGKSLPQMLERFKKRAEKL
ncbi:MAG: SRPBCC family protein [Deltaproteobacteria bacterium]|nr:SRPBCC family protein [Deltaproteobacteria bacterium]